VPVSVLKLSHRTSKLLKSKSSVGIFPDKVLSYKCSRLSAVKLARDLAWDAPSQGISGEIQLH
jgi:hypothetical protein